MERTELQRQLEELERARAELAATSGHFKAVLDAATEFSIIATDTQGLITMFSRGSERMLGYAAEEVIGKCTPMSFHLESEVRLRGEELGLELGRNVSGFDVFVEGARRFGSETREWKYVRKDGSLLSVQLTVTVMRDHHERITGYLGVAEDISERKRMERELVEEKELLGTILESIPNPVFYKDPNGVYLNCNKAFSSFLGIPREKIIGSTAYDLAPRELADVYHNADLALMREKDVQIYEAQVRSVDGDFRDILFYKSAILTNSGSLRGLVGVMLDITERKWAENELHAQAVLLEEEIAERQRSEEVLREREQMLSLIINAVPQYIFWKDTNSIYLGCNGSFARAAGLDSPEDVVGKTDYDLPWLKEESEAYRSDDREVMTHDRAKYHIIETQLQADGTQISVDTTKIPLHAGDGTVIGVVGVYDDITERKRAEEALRASEEQLRVIFETSQAGIILVSAEGKITYANERMAKMFGCTLQELLGTSYTDYLHPSELASGDRKMFQLISGEIDHVHHERHYLRKDGRDFWAYLSGRRLERPDGSLRALVGIIADITQRKEIEEELFKVRKLESLGVLAGGIAHDFNNLLTAILGNISLARLNVPVGGELSHLLERAQKASERARDLTQQLLTFSRGGAPVKKLTSIVQILKESADFALRGSNVRCSFEIADDLWPAEIDAGQMSQVINNLVINADQAMPDGGILTIRAENVSSPHSAGGELGQKKCIRLTIRDMGIGIPQEYLQRIFDPYFTTKQQGSGLGLASVYSIVRNHDGEIKVSSQPGRGTTFVILLPAVAVAPPVEKEGAAMRLQGAGRILVMDDDELIRESLEVALRMFGYEPAACGDGEEALKLYGEAMAAGTPFAAVIMDLTIPGGMGGEEAARELLRMDPSARVIVSSGYSNDPIMAHYAEYGFCGAVAKPYNCVEFGGLLREVLAR